ncbi:MAG: hypothetical protein J6B34_03900 [Clostridia bacterium]|nr:hypothetical protein [Clostridia bacterium]
MKEKYQNKLFSILGDSISTLSGYSEPDDASFYEGVNKLQADVLAPEDTWWGQVIEYLRGTLLVNNSFSGSMVCKHRSCIIPSYGCSDERTSSLSRKGISPDIIMVFMGTNDWGCGARLTPAREEENNDISIFSVAYEDMLKKLKRNYPNAEIWCFTIPVSNYKKAKGIDFPYCYGGNHIEEYCKIIRACASKHSCRIIDLYASEVLYDTIDGFHPDKEGMKALAKAVISQINQ